MLALLHHRCDSLLNAVFANEIRCWIAVQVGLCQDQWEPRYLTTVLVFTSVLSAKCTGSGGASGLPKARKFNVEFAHEYKAKAFLEDVDESRNYRLCR